jgi:hypothetical protein
LPPDLLSLPAAANCAALRSTSYRMVAPRYSSLDEETTVASIDATGLTVTTDQGVQTLTPNGDCRYTLGNDPNHPGDAIVSPAGVIVARYFAPDDGAYRMALLFPEQSHPLADFQGDWSFIGAEQSTPATGPQDARYTAAAGWASIDAAGHVGDVHFCPGLANCQATGETFTFAVDDRGGFTDDAPDGSARWFLYQAAGGSMGVILNGDGSIEILSPSKTNTLPAEGSESHSWNIWANTQLLSTAATSSSDFTVTSVDAAAGSWNRQAGNDGHVETLLLNNPLNGYTHRAAATATTSAGTTVTVQDFTSLPLTGMGMSALWLPDIGDTASPGALMLSVQRP